MNLYGHIDRVVSLASYEELILAINCDVRDIDVTFVLEQLIATRLWVNRR